MMKHYFHFALSFCILLGSLQAYASLGLRGHREEVLCGLAPKDDDFKISEKLQKCINEAPPGSRVSLRPGVYRLEAPIVISNSIELSTLGKKHSDPACISPKDSSCAELLIRRSLNEKTFGAIGLQGRGIHVHHMIFNGNKEFRWSSLSGQKCQEEDNGYGFTLAIKGDEIKFEKNIVKNTLCGTGLAVLKDVRNLELENNTFLENGIHDGVFLWSDGLTMHEAIGAKVRNNLFKDNTDIDFVLGGCTNCEISHNRVIHSDTYRSSSFAAFHIHAWPKTSGNYAGTRFHHNEVDCGKMRRCGVGIMIGSDPWYKKETFGGRVYRNTVKNAQFGIILDNVHGSEVYSNTVKVSDDAFKPEEFVTSCGNKKSRAYTISPDSTNILFENNHPRSEEVVSEEFDFCIPNTWFAPYPPIKDANDSFLPKLPEQFIELYKMFAPEREMLESRTRVFLKNE